MLQRLLDDFRSDWNETEKFGRDYHLAFAILHGQLERMDPAKYSGAIEAFFREVQSVLWVSEDPSSQIVPNMQESMTHGLGIAVFNNGPYMLTPEDVAQINKVKGYFGAVIRQDHDGARIALVDDQDVRLLDTPFISAAKLDAMKFPKVYREEGSGICWVEYELKDGSGFGSLEPASSLD